MDLLNILLGSMTSSESVDAIAQKAGVSSDQASKLITGSLPLLLNGMTSNASTEEGAKSLADALTQHTSTGTMVQQISDVDEADGEKIVRHILGDNSAGVVQALAQETQMDTDQVTRGLASLAPALMSVLSAAMKLMQGNSGSGMDLSSLFGMFGGSQQNASSSLGLLTSLMGGSSQSSGIGSLIGGLFGGGSQAQSGSALSGMLGGLLGGASQSSTSGGGLLGGSSPSGGGLLSSLFGGGASQNTQQQDTSAFDGTQLLGILTSLMK